jgi:putative oxidoreductase
MQCSNAPIGRLWGLLPLRLIMGCGFLIHGLAKWNRGPANFGKLLAQLGTPMPVATAYLVTFLEIGGGVALLLGLFVAVVAIPLIVTMVVATATVHWRYGFSSINTIGLTPDGPVFGPPGYELNLLYVAGLVALVVMGAGAASIDGWRLRRKHRANPRRTAAELVTSNGP